MNQLAVHVIAPTGRDADLIQQTLRNNDVNARICVDSIQLLRGDTSEIGPLLIAEEALVPELVRALDDMLRERPAWSDPPLLLLTTAGRETPESQRLARERIALGDPVLLERPIRSSTLLASVRAALRARKRQFQVRDTLAERDEALRWLRIERETLETMLDNLPVGVLMAEPDGRIVRGNAAVERILRHPILQTLDIASHGDWVSFHPDGHRVLGHEYPLPRAMESRKAVGPVDVLYQRGDGSSAWVSLTASPVIDDRGTLLGGVVAISDVDAERRAADELRTSEERFRRLIENSSIGLLIGTFDGSLSYMNPSLLALLGYTAEEVRNGSVRWSDLTPPEFAEADQRAIEQLRARGVSDPYQKAYRSKDGRVIPLLFGATLIPTERDGHTEEVAVFITDLSEQKKAETALVQSEKLAAVGRLAASISHEINNPLEAVTNLLYLAKHEDLPPQAMTYLLLAEQELARVSQIAGQTLRFHRQATRARPVTPKELLEPVIALYQGRLNNSNIEVAIEDRDAGEIVCFEGDIRQVLNNLVSNAIDSMRTGGRLVLRARDSHSRTTGRPGVRITVADTGHGMAEAVRRRIFEAFYTTKGINGTGLGLWISIGIVDKHEGHLHVCSSCDPQRHGTVFSLFLPTDRHEPS